MEGFLECLAAELYKKFGDDFSSLNIILPNNRARLFFNDALAKLVKKPIWQARFLSLDELMGEISSLSVVDNVPLVAELYKVYREFYSDETFDTFYFWGEMLLADFDAVDKYLIDAKMLFTNVAELKALDDLSYLDEKQIEIIQHFWKSFNIERGWSKEQEKFYDIWSKLYDIYIRFKENLSLKSMAYTGMMYRDVAERLKGNMSVENLDGKRFVIAGFNALSGCEKRLFDYLSSKCDSLFFWDYDDYYLKNQFQEAGLFMRENLIRYPQKISLGSTNNFAGDKKIKVVSVPSDALQARYVNKFLSDIPNVDKRTAVVLTDENLLLPVIYSVPGSVDNVNITMGFPLLQSLAYSFTERLLELQKHVNKSERFYHVHVLGLLSHPYLMQVNGERAEYFSAKILRRGQAYISGEEFKGEGLLEKIFCSVGDWTSLSDYLIEVLSEVSKGQDKDSLEFFSLIIEHIYKVTNSAKSLELELTNGIYVSLLRRTLQKIRVPYQGEPLLGLQIMGILETRNLDFDNVLVLSMNDDNFPGNRSTSSSFVPFALRMAYGMPTPAHHEGVYAYYFYRLIQRAKHVELVYSTQSDDKKTGEKSRYIYQLNYESDQDIEHVDYELDVNLNEQNPICIAKDETVMSLLRQYVSAEDRIISPTAFYSYVECPLKFYFRYLAGIKVDKELADEVDSPTFGNILHHAMEMLYDKNKGYVNEQAGKLIDTDKVSKCVQSAVQSEYLKGDNLSFEQWGGNLLLVHDIIVKYINQCILPFDFRQDKFLIKDMETKEVMPFEVDFMGSKSTVYVGGMVDRLDEIGAETLRVVDYKTGGIHKEFKGVESLFLDNASTRSSAVLQTMIYSMVLNYNYKKDIVPSLYYVRLMKDKDYSPLLEDVSLKGEQRKVRCYQDYKEDFERLFLAKLSEIFDDKASFTQCEDSKPCQWCDYKEICKR